MIDFFERKNETRSWEIFRSPCQGDALPLSYATIKSRTRILQSTFINVKALFQRALSWFVKAISMPSSLHPSPLKNHFESPRADASLMRACACCALSRRKFAFSRFFEAPNDCFKQDVRAEFRIFQVEVLWACTQELDEIDSHRRIRAEYLTTFSSSQMKGKSRI